MTRFTSISCRRFWPATLFVLLFYLSIIGNGDAKTPINPGDPVSFFTTVADKMLRNTFSFGVTNIPVYTNGAFVYSPAVQRILQLSANVYDATTTNFYPTVFRPLFEHDNLGNVFIVGYTNLSFNGVPNTVGLNGADDQLSVPFDAAEVINYGAINQPMLTNNAGINIYGVPWIIGAKKGFPNFNKLGMQNIVQVTRKLQVRRSNIPTVLNSTTFATNQLLAFSISNSITVEYWNSYSNNYPNPVLIFARDTLSMRVTNNTGSADTYFNDRQLNNSLLVSPWPGYGGSTPTLSFTNPFSGISFLLSNADFYFGSSPPGVSGFYSDTLGYGWESNKFDFPFPQFGLLVTNRLQLYMLDNSLDGNYRVIDYVHFTGPQTALDITAAIETNNPATIGYGLNMWSQSLDAGGLPYGIKSQLAASLSPVSANGGNQYWSDTALTEAQIDGFSGFMGWTWPYPLVDQSNPNVAAILQSYATNYVVQVPYTPTVTVSQYTSWQANDPLVHYLASDLNYFGTEAVSQTPTGVQVLYSAIGNVLHYPRYDVLNDRYQPWGKAAYFMYQTTAYNFLNAYNLIYKDPLVWSADYWSFPTSLISSLSSLGQVHRGTPWQTIYLKADDVLRIIPNGFSVSAGTNTWMAWTGDTNATDAAIMAPINDRPLVGLLIALLNTNDATQLVSVNDPNTSDWLNLINGLTVYSNSIALPSFTLPQSFPFPSPTFDSYIITSNSLQAQIIANAIAQARAAHTGQNFDSTGDILSALELTENSPWLNIANTNQLRFGISDAVYEAIPAQLLPLLRPDSVGNVLSAKGVWNLQFSGSDAYDYELQTSTDLVNWVAVSTNNPVGGHFTVPISSGSNASKQFYRSVLLP